MSWLNCDRDAGVHSADRAGEIDGVPELPYATVTPDLSATTGAAGFATVMLTVPGAEVPPGPVAV